MLHDRVLVSLENEGERRSGGGILIPATASVGKRLAWAEVVATGPTCARSQLGDRVLFDPEDRAEVELHGKTTSCCGARHPRRRRARVDDGQTGLYLSARYPALPVSPAGSLLRPATLTVRVRSVGQIGSPPGR